MTNQISQKIDSFAKKHLKELKQLEKQNGREFTKYDIAEYMLSKGEINKPELNSWLKTTEGSQNYQLSSYQKKISLFGNNNIAQNFDILDKFEKKSYLDSLTDKIEINGKKYEDTIENRKIAKQVRTQKDRLNTQFEKLVEENQDLVDPNDTRNVVELTKDINTSIENERFDKMTHEARKNHITSKFLSAYNKNDKEGMFNALGEFNAYMCQYIDDKLGITDAKQSIKEFVHLDDLVAYVDKHVDDGNNAISIMEGLWEFTKGLGDAADSFIGAQGLEMAGLLGAASKAIQASGKAAPVRFAEVPEGVKGIVGKEGFQPITGGDLVIAIDVKGQPYINTTSYVRNNTKGLSQDAVKVLDKVEGKTAQPASAKPSVSKELQEELYDSMFFSDYYPNKITTEDISLIITKYPEVITRLAECKTPEGKLLFPYYWIIDFCLSKNVQKVIDSNPEKLFVILNNPREMTSIMKDKSPTGRMHRALLAESQYPEFMNKLSEYNTPDGQQLFDYVELTYNILINPLINPNRKYVPEVFELLDNPRDISYIKSLKYEDRAEAIRGALRQTRLKDDTSPISQILRSQLEDALRFAKYDKTEVWNMIDKYPEVVAKLADCKTPDGQLLFKPQEICDILSSCQSAVINTPQVIFDMINTPNVKTELLNSENKAFVLWKRLYY